MSTTTLTDEQLRILRAARDGRLRTEKNRGFWLVEDDLPPMNHERTRLRNLGLLKFVPHANGMFVGLLTDAGREALEAT